VGTDGYGQNIGTNQDCTNFQQTTAGAKGVQAVQ
jgi:hypothetical protein